MRRFPELLSNVILRDPARVFGRVYVVSADEQVTDLLLENTRTGEPGVHARFARRKDYRFALRKLGEHLLSINQSLGHFGLDLDAADEFIGHRIEAVYGALDSMSHLLTSGYVKPAELLSAAREILASVGDAHAAFNASSILRSRGIPAVSVDLSGWGESSEPRLDERMGAALAEHDPHQSVLFVTGYCKGTEGVMRQLDRDYADLVFARVAVMLGVGEAILHGDHALLSADPAVVDPASVRAVRRINYDVAGQLADIGQAVVHPRAVELLERKGIPLRINNAFATDDDSTTITKDYMCPDASIEIVAGSDRVSLLEVHDGRMVGEVGTDLHVMEVLLRRGVSYVCKSTNANTIALIVWDRDLKDDLVAELRAAFESVESRQVAIVCAIGSNIARPGVLARAAGALAAAGVNIICIAQTARQTNIQFVVTRQDFLAAQRALHGMDGRDGV